MTSQWDRSLSDEVRAAFAQAVLEHRALQTFNGEDWARYRKIKQDFAARRHRAQQRFEREYQARFETTRRKLIDEAGSRQLTLTHRWFGRDRFDATALNRQADRTVRREHQTTLATLKVRELAAVGKLSRAANERAAIRDKIRVDFDRAANSRSGPHQRRRQSP
jgi:hypothetical protein